MGSGQKRCRMVKGGMINAKMRDEGGSARTLGAVKIVFPRSSI
jgi:hypothetical protein